MRFERKSWAAKSLKRAFRLAVLAGACSIWGAFMLRASPSSISVELDAGEKVINAWVVFTQGALEQGLSDVSWLGEDEGMIFVLPKNARVKFHMEGVKIPLSIAYINWRGKILKIEDMDPEMPERIYEAPEGARYALEMNQGWFERNGLKPGDPVRRRH